MVLPSVDDATSFEATLTQCEQKFLKGYEDKMPHGIYSLNQNPDVTCMGTHGKVGLLKAKTDTHTILNCSSRGLTQAVSTKDFIHCVYNLCTKFGVILGFLRALTSILIFSIVQALEGVLHGLQCEKSF